MNKVSFPVNEVLKQVQSACEVRETWAGEKREVRAEALRALAAGLNANKQRLIDLADSETHLGESRLRGEVDRTCFQLNAFAELAESADFSKVQLDPAVPGAPPQGHPLLTQVQVPLGPVAMFSASNFPFAFSVLGGDTASALAAGCPVVVRAHPGHPLLSAAVWSVARDALSDLALPPGILGMVSDPSHETGINLVRHPGIQAVAFTGSLKGGMALLAHAQGRDQPIPFFGELGSVNPVVVLPKALGIDLGERAKELAASMVQGAGQFCTSPGLVLMLKSSESEAFASVLAAHIDEAPMHAMLSGGIRSGYLSGLAGLEGHAKVKTLTTAAGESRQHGFVGVADGESYLKHPELRHEVFGTACLVVLAGDYSQLNEILEAVGGALTVTLWGADAPTPENKKLLRVASRVAGRVLFSGVPTGVAITRWQHHGGPWPASTQAKFTSVGLSAAERFLRPVVLQDAPAWASFV